jgi:AraC-like DNA-binding protein
MVERVWHATSEAAGFFTATAGTHGMLVVAMHEGRTIVTLRGPATRISIADFPAGAEWVGVTFKLGVFFPDFPPATLRNRHEIDLPEGAPGSFRLNDSCWEVPDFENMDTFVGALVREGLLVHEPVVDAVLDGHRGDLSLRAIQGRFHRATGITYRTMQQIERAQRAAALLEQGMSILDTVVEAGYYDQPHLTRSLKHYLGQTPGKIARSPEALKGPGG